MKSINAFIFTLVSSILTVLSSNVLADNTLSANLSINNHYFTHNSDVHVKVTLTNDSSDSIAILKWLLPKGELDDDIFIITRDGVEVDYEGRLIKRRQPGKEDYIYLSPQEKYTTLIELSTAYDLKRSGSYEVQLNTDKLIGLSAETVEAPGLFSQKEYSVMTDSVSFWLDGSQYSAREEPSSTENVSKTATRASTQYCSNSEKNSINSADSAAESLASNAYSYLSNGNTGSRYTTWFGSYNSSRYSTVRSNFSSILSAIKYEPVVYNCSCNENYYAYVYPNSPYKIYLCNAFWSAPLTGTDSKAGTIIHEISHFNVVAGTRDYAYGQYNAKNLAVSNPNTAVRNADSHEYFAENTPYQN